jgi:hypothetical protein
MTRVYVFDRVRYTLEVKDGMVEVRSEELDCELCKCSYCRCLNDPWFIPQSSDPFWR